MEQLLVMGDNEALLQFLSTELSSEGYFVQTQEIDNLQTLDMIYTYTVILLAFLTKEEIASDYVKRIRKKNQSAIIMVLTSHREEAIALKVFEEGADDYISRPYASKEILLRIRAHLRHVEKKPSIHSYMDVQIHPEKRLVKISNQPVSLTKKEYELLYYFLLHHNIVISREEILKTVWNAEQYNTRIVDVHTHHLRMKLQNSQVDIKSCRGVGYMMVHRLNEEKEST